MIWREKKISRIGTGQIDKLGELFDIRRMYTVPNTRIRELDGVTKRVGEKID